MGAAIGEADWSYRHIWHKLRSAYKLGYPVLVSAPVGPEHKLVLYIPPPRQIEIIFCAGDRPRTRDI